MVGTKLRRFYAVGEARRIEWNIVPNDPDDTVVITGARYEILDENNETTETGQCDVDGMKVGVLFRAETAGTYLVRIFVTVPPETAETEIVCSVR